MSTYFRTHTRLPDFDYRSNHAYFVTVVTAGREPVFGTIRDGVLCPSQRGMIAARVWHDLPNHHPFVELDAFVVMPNHVHGIVCVTGNDFVAPPLSGRLTARSIGAVVGSYKSAVTRAINRLRPGAAARLWQTNFYEHVIRSDRSLSRIRDYIAANPLRWEDDSENLSGTRRDDVEAFTRSLRADERTGPEKGDAGVAAT